MWPSKEVLLDVYSGGPVKSQPAIYSSTPTSLLLLCHLTTRAYKQAIHFNVNGERESRG